MLTVSGITNFSTSLQALLKIIWAFRAVYADQIDRFTAQSNGRTFLAQDVDVVLREQAADRVFRILFVVPKAAEDAVGRMEARERLNNFALRPSVLRKVIACHYDQ